MPAGSERPVRILACSPRKGGNSDFAAELVLQVLSDNGRRGETLHLRDYRVEPCIGCGACSRWAQERAASAAAEDVFAPGNPAKFFLGCPLSLKDDSRALLSAVADAGGLYIAAPIYFYHLPAQLKAFLDRTQPFWALKQAGCERSPAAPRPCGAILIGARTRGEKLFEGSLLTLAYALAPLGFLPPDPLLLYGLEQAGELAGDKAAVMKVSAYARSHAANV